MYYSIRNKDKSLKHLRCNHPAPVRHSLLLKVLFYSKDAARIIALEPTHVSG